jgi:hypothetical protein
VRKIPTFFLAFKSMHPELRNKLNVVFSVTFFLTRILLHVILGVSYSLHDNRTRITDGSYVPSLVMASVFPLHVMWFYGSIKGFMRRAARRRALVSTTINTLPVDQKVNPLPESQLPVKAVPVVKPSNVVPVGKPSKAVPVVKPSKTVPVVKPSKISTMLDQPIPLYHPVIIRSLNIRSFTVYFYP